jgi:hypothetical protein
VEAQLSIVDLLHRSLGRRRNDQRVVCLKTGHGAT